MFIYVLSILKFSTKYFLLKYEIKYVVNVGIKKLLTQLWINKKNLFFSNELKLL